MLKLQKNFLVIMVLMMAFGDSFAMESKLSQIASQKKKNKKKKNNNKTDQSLQPQELDIQKEVQKLINGDPQNIQSSISNSDMCYRENRKKQKKQEEDQNQESFQIGAQLQLYSDSDQLIPRGKRKPKTSFDIQEESKENPDLKQEKTLDDYVKEILKIQEDGRAYEQRLFSLKVEEEIYKGSKKVIEQIINLLNQKKENLKKKFELLKLKNKEFVKTFSSMRLLNQEDIQKEQNSLNEEYNKYIEISKNLDKQYSKIAIQRSQLQKSDQDKPDSQKREYQDQESNYQSITIKIQSLMQQVSEASVNLENIEKQQKSLFEQITYDKGVNNSLSNNQWIAAVKELDKLKIQIDSKKNEKRDEIRMQKTQQSQQQIKDLKDQKQEQYQVIRGIQLSFVYQCFRKCVLRVSDVQEYISENKELENNITFEEIESILKSASELIEQNQSMEDLQKKLEDFKTKVDFIKGLGVEISENTNKLFARMIYYIYQYFQHIKSPNDESELMKLIYLLSGLDKNFDEIVDSI
jgi:hypothetical protein